MCDTARVCVEAYDTRDVLRHFCVLSSISSTYLFCREMKNNAFSEIGCQKKKKSWKMVHGIRNLRRDQRARFRILGIGKYKMENKNRTAGSAQRISLKKQSRKKVETIIIPLF